MTFDDLGHWTHRLGAGEKLGAAAKRLIEAELPEFIRNLSPASAPPRLRLPTGESLTNATRMTGAHVPVRLPCANSLWRQLHPCKRRVRIPCERRFVLGDEACIQLKRSQRGFSVARHALFPYFPCMRPPAFAGLIATNWHPMSSEPWTKVHRFLREHTRGHMQNGR
jgi:hypothetical protein